jgi:hypothetical protein
MDRLAVERAKELHRRHPGLSFPVDMEWLTNAEGCELMSWPFLSPVKEVKRGRWIGIAAGLEPSERRYLAAHALAHHLLHCGNQLLFYSWDKTILWKQEHEANVCATHILMPEEELNKLSKMPVWELADYFGVPEYLVQLRLKEFATERELSSWRKVSR